MAVIKVMFFGDVMGKIGRKGLIKVLPKLKKKYNPDLVLANGENLAHGSGISELTLKEMMDAGIDYLTSGNHIFDKKDSRELINRPESTVLRPANYPDEVNGFGEKTIEIGSKRVGLINLIGRSFMANNYDCPFRTGDRIINKMQAEGIKIIIVDFHAEATSEKKALGHYLDGRISLLVGTHTHVATADGEVLPGGTGYITDVGMVGEKYSVLGEKKESVIDCFLTQMPFQHHIAEDGLCLVNGLIAEINTVTGQCQELIMIKEDIKV